MQILGYYVIIFWVKLFLESFENIMRKIWEIFGKKNIDKNWNIYWLNFDNNFKKILKKLGLNLMKI